MPGPYFDDEDHRNQPTALEHRARWRAIEVINQGSSAEKRRHHFVPGMWLRNWADPETERLEVVDVENETSFSTGARNVMLVTDLYRVGVETAAGIDMGPEDTFAQIEGAAASAMAGMFEGHSPTDHERYDLALLIALQHVRVPEVIATAVPDDPGGLREAVETFAAAMFAQPDGPPPPELKESALGRSSHELAELALDGFDGFADLERGFAFWNLLDAAHHLAGRIYRRQWTVFATESVLLLSDDPVAVRPLGNTTVKAGGETLAYDTPVPVGPHTLLLIGDRPDGEGKIPADSTELYAGLSNEIQIARAGRFLIGPPVDQ